MSYDGYLSTNSRPPYHFAASHRNLRNRSHPQPRSHFKRLSDSRYYQYRPGTAPQLRSSWASVFVTEYLIARTHTCQYQFVSAKTCNPILLVTSLINRDSLWELLYYSVLGMRFYSVCSQRIPWKQDVMRRITVNSLSLHGINTRTKSELSAVQLQRSVKWLRRRSNLLKWLNNNQS